MAFTEYLPNNALAAVADECLQEVGAPKWDDADYRMAKEFLNTYPATTLENIKSQIIETYGEDRLEEILERPLDSEIHPFNPDKIKLTAGSTDVGDVGYAAPTLNINIATACNRKCRTLLADGCPVLQPVSPQGTPDRGKSPGSLLRPHHGPPGCDRSRKERTPQEKRWTLFLARCRILLSRR